MDIVIIVTAIAVVYSSSTTIMVGWLQSLLLPLLEKGEGGRGLFPPHCCGGGDDTKCCCCHCKEGSWSQLWKILFHSSNLVITFLFGSVESWLSRIVVFGIDTRQGSKLFKFFPPHLTLVAWICACIIDGSLDWVFKELIYYCLSLAKIFFHSSKFGHHIFAWQL